MRTLIIIPTYNERPNLGKLVESLFALPDLEAELLVVDDASPDGTGEVADSLARQHRGVVHVLHRPAKSGLGSAYLDGFSWAMARGFDAVCQMDADGSHDAADLPALLSSVAHCVDVAIGSRRVSGGKIEGWGPLRHAMSWCAARVTQRILRLKTKDITAGFRCLNQAAVRTVLEAQVESAGYAFQEESLCALERAGLHIKEVPVTFRDRQHGKSKLGLGDVIEFFRTLRRLR